MANPNAPFGLRPVRHLNNSGISYDAGTIASGYASNIFTGDPVILSSGNVQPAIGSEGTPSTAIYGVFAGCSYNDAQGLPHYSNYWPASTVATNIVANVYTDPGIIFEVQTNASGATQVTIGNKYHINMATAGVVAYGQSSAVLDTSGAGAYEFLVESISTDPNNATGAYALVEVSIAGNIRKG